MTDPTPVPAPWTHVFGRIKAQIPAVPDALIRQEIWATMYDFTADTNVWIEQVPVAIEPQVMSYIIPVTSGFPHRLMIVYNNDPDNPSASSLRWADSGITMRVPGTLQLYRVPDAAKSWTAVVAKVVNEERTVGVNPPLTSTGYPEIDDWIVDVHGDTIFYGTMYLLQRMPSKPFNNPTAARENQLIYSSSKAALRVNNMRSNVYGGQTWQFPQGYATISRKGWV